MIFRAGAIYENLGVKILLESRDESDRRIGPAWTVRLASMTQEGSDLPSWSFSLEESARKHYGELQTIATLLDAIERMKRGAH
jgi:hypothetical protein